MEAEEYTDTDKRDKFRSFKKIKCEKLPRMDGITSALLKTDRDYEVPHGVI